MNKGYFDFIEIGSADFETLIETVNDDVRGITVEPLKEYFDNLPNKKNVIKVQAAISGKDGSDLIYYIDQAKIKEHGLPEWTSGSNSLGQLHPFLTKFYGEEFYSSLVETREVKTMTFQTLVSTYNVQGIGYLKIDTEGHDHIILKGYLEVCEKNPNLLAETIHCEYDKLISNVEEMDKVLKEFKKYYYVVKGKNDCIMTTKQTIFYQSSMPRAGSTLLQNLIGQNPAFHVTPTSGMIDLMLGARIGYNGNKEAQAGDKKMWKEGFYAFCKAGLNAYVANLTDKPYILDKNRNWAASYPLLTNIYPNSKVLFLVRDLRCIFASMEKKFRANPDIEDGTVDNMNLTGLTTQQRVERWAAGHPIGHALPKLHQSILDKTAQKFLFIRYEDLCADPEPQLKSIYDYLEAPYFEHNYKNIPQITIEDDTVHGIYGDHTIRNTLGMLPDDSKDILGEYTYEWIYENFRWYFDIFGYKK
jgi:sulfotransferase